MPIHAHTNAHAPFTAYTELAQPPPHFWEESPRQFDVHAVLLPMDMALAGSLEPL